VFQEICKEKSTFCNAETLRRLKKPSCALIQLPSIHIDFSNPQSMAELERREEMNKVDVRVTPMLKRHGQTSMRTINHPTTFLFFEIMDEICDLANMPRFTDDEKRPFLQNDNYMGLP
jgi:hypothetical protein